LPDVQYGDAVEFQSDPFEGADECFRMLGIRGAFVKPARFFWWQSVQFTAFDFAVFQVRSVCR
jgi:hypothetical protein